MPPPIDLDLTATGSEAAVGVGIGASRPLATQVGGHDGVLSDASGSLVIKPALAREIAFYQTLNQSRRDAKEDQSSISQLRKFVPRFYGTLRLEGQLTPSGGVDKSGLGGNVPESVVLQNLSYKYTHPSILDVKLGTVLHDPDASEEKQIRMDKCARETTSHETGIRLTGFQTWHAPSQSYIVTPKSFGKTITVTQLPSGMVRFFPLPTDTLTPLIMPPSPPPTASSSTSALPPAPPLHTSASTSATNINTAPPTPLSAVPVPSQGLERRYTNHSITPDLLIRVLDLLLEEIDKLVALLEHLEIRFVGSSILVVYEGDPERLRTLLERYDEVSALKNPGTGTGNAKDSCRSAFSDDGSEPDMSDSDFDDDDDEEEEKDDDDDDGDRDEDDEVGGKGRRRRYTPPVTVKMIDFAHTWLVEGEGPDLGVLKGLKTFEELVIGRREEVREVASLRGTGSSLK